GEDSSAAGRRPGDVGFGFSPRRDAPRMAGQSRKPYSRNPPPLQSDRLADALIRLLDMQRALSELNVELASTSVGSAPQKGACRSSARSRQSEVAPVYQPCRTSRILRHPWFAPSPCAGPVPPIRLGKRGRRLGRAPLRPCGA